MYFIPELDPPETQLSFFYILGRVKMAAKKMVEAREIF